MSKQSAVQFHAESRIHIGLGVSDVKKSMAFYESLFGKQASKVRPGYAKFETAEPSLNLSLNQVRGENAPSNEAMHYGIQVKSSDAVAKYRERLREAGYNTIDEDSVVCCYATQDKVWASDPDGNRWEVYVVLDDDATQRASTADECCADPAACDSTCACSTC